MKNCEGETITSRKGIAHVQGEFYSKLYAETQFGESSEKESCSEDVKHEIPKFTQDEVQIAIDNFEKGKASDNNGIRAEDIKTCDATTKEMIRQIFNEVLKQDDCTPET